MTSAYDFQATMTSPAIKTLKLCVTACCACRRVQTGDGKWSDGEDLLSLAEPRGIVTHGICEECLPKIYPEMADHILSKHALQAS
jgi:hypothetical protein